jgi:hypothetical protein
VYFNINFCPMCRKKVLGDDKDEWRRKESNRIYKRV